MDDPASAEESRGDPGAQGHEDRVVAAARGTESMLGEQTRAHVVPERHGEPARLGSRVRGWGQVCQPRLEQVA